MTMKQKLPSFDKGIDEKLSLYVRGLRNFVRGNIDWSPLDTAQYGLVDMKFGI
jgi:hypothetical protein